ncbi:MAG TPA: gamma-glutamyl-gamma-aminobutyrate hydrolase family protein [Streptosporangiaceae bacterium]|jgi:anthranilate synthase component 2/putative glutamine amidotransferase
MNGPVIGLTSYVEPARWGLWDTTANLLPYDYVRSLTEAGARPVILPPVDGAETLIDRLDGLVLVGGGDVDPARYGAERDPRTDPPRAFRDHTELALADAALTAGLPTLGVCRGLQVVNVLRGGTLHQHLPDLVGHDGHSPTPGTFGRHRVTIAPGSRLAKIVDGEAASVPTHHHQAVDRLGDGLVPVAWSDDGIVEAAELDGHPFALAVQWHPEAGTDPSLFRALVAASAH